jgi:hypothetical protein
MTDCCAIDLTLGGSQQIVLVIDPPPSIEFVAEVESIELELGTSAGIELSLAAVEEMPIIELDLASQGMQGNEGPQAGTFGSFVAGENITSSSFTHISEDDGLLYLADFEEDRPANSFTISGCLSGQSLTVLRYGLLYGLGGIVAGKEYWLGIGGQIRTSVPDHGITQSVGVGSTSTAIVVSIEESIEWE